VSGDHGLAAAILAHMSFVAAHAGDAPTTRDALTAAQAHALHHASPMTRSWLYAVETETSATLHEPAAAMRSLRHSQELAAAAPAEPQPVWFDFFSEARLAGFAGHANLLLGRGSAARPYLEESLAGLGTDDGKQRSVVLADLALSYADDDVEASCAMARLAIDELGASWYATGAERLRGVQAALAPHAESREVREIEARLRDL
jgi:hypothetical protein